MTGVQTCALPIFPSHDKSVCRLGKEVVTMTVTQSVTTKDGVVWYVVDGKGQKHIYVKSQFESCFTISQDVLGYKDS